MRTRFFLLLLYLPFTAFAQDFYTLSGFVTEAESGEKLIGASVFSPTLQRGTSTNNYGFFSLNLPSDSVVLTFSYVGYESYSQSTALRADTTIEVELKAGTTLDEIVISDKNAGISPADNFKLNIPAQLADKAPALLGEGDILKVIQLLPGVQSGNEGTAGLYVRGGGPDQNLILLDGVPVYNVFHLFGFFSLFNSDALNHVNFYKDHIPARFGGRLSSVLDISMKEGNQKEFEGNFAISPIAGRLTLQGPIIKNKASYILSARRTWLDAITTPLLNYFSDGDQVIGYNFHDINAKVNYRFSAKDHLYLSSYLGRDRFYSRLNFGGSDYDFGFRWGNVTSVLRWNRLINPRWFSNLSMFYSQYDFAQEQYFESENNQQFGIEESSGIRDFAAKLDLEYTPAKSHQVKFGVSATNHLFRPESNRTSQGDSLISQTISIPAIRAIDAMVYVEDAWKINYKWKANIGLNTALFRVEEKNYWGLQPRIAINFQPRPDITILASYNQMFQYLHLLSNASLGLPTDLWLPSTAMIPPQTARQYTIRVNKEFPKQAFLLGLSAYWKPMKNLIAYRPGVDYLFDLNDDWQDKVARGNGEAYGMELFVEKKKGKTTGWVGYTLSWSNREFELLNQGDPFPYRYDRRHDISLYLQHDFKPNRSLSATFVYGTGNALTLPITQYEGLHPPGLEGNTAFYQRYDTRSYNGRLNFYRMPAYHRVDLSYTMTRQKENGERSWIFSVYNAYSRQNPFFLFQMEEGFKQLSLFPIVPSVTYKYSFR